MRLIRYVYVAGPIHTSGRTSENISLSITAAEELVKKGFVPFVPHLFFYWDAARPNTPEYWLKLDKSWLSRCDAVLRLPGRSEGADLEEKWAADLGMPVYKTVEEIAKAASCF